MKQKKPRNNMAKSLTAAILLSPLSVLASSDDSRIESSFKNTYVYKTFLEDDSIAIQSKDGNVVLSGMVAVDSNKSLAEDTAENLPGVKKVDNQIKVSDESPSEMSDAWVTLKVSSVLLFHSNVSALDTEVETVDGVVTLRGEAPSRAHRALAGEYASDVKGVKQLRNEITIAKMPMADDRSMKETHDDASITAQVKAALRTHHSTSNSKTEVHTTKGVVTVTGIADNAAEKSLVSKLINDIHGVTEVVNSMTLEAAKQ